jgi:hypothetical protein
MQFKPPQIKITLLEAVKINLKARFYDMLASQVPAEGNGQDRLSPKLSLSVSDTKRSEVAVRKNIRALESKRQSETLVEAPQSPSELGVSP